LDSIPDRPSVSDGQRQHELADLRRTFRRIDVERDLAAISERIDSLADESA
jgi:hypothetical protein